jgi:hypothetical protein
MSDDKQSKLWQQWAGGLSDAARTALGQDEPTKLAIPKVVRHDDEDEDAYREFAATLTDQARVALDAAASAGAPVVEDVDMSVARFGLVEAPDGEWASIKLFKTAEGLARRVGMLEGEDMVVWGFVGFPLQLTRGPQRYLLLPGDEAVMVPMYEGGPVKRVPADLVESLPVQEDGYIGPPELANTKVVHAKLGSESGQPAATGQDADDEDDGEEPEGSNVD